MYADLFIHLVTYFVYVSVWVCEALRSWWCQQHREVEADCVTGCQGQVTSKLIRSNFSLSRRKLLYTCVSNYFQAESTVGCTKYTHCSFE